MSHTCKVRRKIQLIKAGELGSQKTGGSRRIFLSNLEDYLGEERAHSLVKDLSASGA